MQNDPLNLAVASDQASALGGVLSDLESRSQSLGHALTQTFAQALTGSKNLDDALKGLALKLSGMALSAGLKPLENLLGNALGGLGGDLFKGFAKGGIPPGGIQPFASGGVVSAPTYFQSGSGMGLMGEAGAEAILPLKRGPDGALGVASAGGGMGAGAPVVFNITTPDVQGFRRAEADIAAMMARTVRRGQRHL